MMPQNLDALFTALSGMPAGARSTAGSGDGAGGAWAEALALFNGSGDDASGLIEAVGTSEGQTAAGLEWLSGLAELSRLIEQSDTLDESAREELLAQLADLLQLLEEAVPEPGQDPAMSTLEDAILAGLAQARERLQSAADGLDQSERPAVLQQALAVLDRLANGIVGADEGRADLKDSTAQAPVALTALQKAMQRAGEAAGSEPAANREAALARLAEVAAWAREGAEAGQGRGMPELTRAVLLSQQFQGSAGSFQAVLTDNPQLARADAQAAPVSAAFAAREPALPPTAQMLGQPAATGAEMRAAAEQAMERVVWMAARQQGISQARLQLHPAHLGKVDIRLDVQGREASVVLNVQNAPVREAVEAMLPRLREQLEGQGIQLGDASVFDSGPDDPEGEAGRESGFAEAGREVADAEHEEHPVQSELNLRGRGLLDAYA